MHKKQKDYGVEHLKVAHSLTDKQAYNYIRKELALNLQAGMINWQTYFNKLTELKRKYKVD